MQIFKRYRKQVRKYIFQLCMITMFPLVVSVCGCHILAHESQSPVLWQAFKFNALQIFF
jgi:hypothetical protein